MPRRRARPFIPPASAGTPISELNTTPLIDVMLVLLIMFIVTIPIATHKVRIDLPTGPYPHVEPQVHELALDANGGLSWDGAALGREQHLQFARFGAIGDRADHGRRHGLETRRQFRGCMAPGGDCAKPGGRITSPQLGENL